MLRSPCIQLDCSDRLCGRRSPDRPLRMARSQRFFPGIQALRAAAAILVVIEHAGSIHQTFTVLGVSYIIPHFSYGRVGITLFFAISGFVIALQRRKPIGTFVLHRLLRIYPSYWLATIVAAVILGIAGLPVSVTAESMLLYPSTTYDPTSAIPYWTLIFEMTFYTLAAVAFGFRLSDRALTVLAVMWNITFPADGFCFRRRCRSSRWGCCAAFTTNA
jgi:exopolysaccharide production protein ExoZ